ncbi:hypothetical protein D3C81_2177400 [compost metagenome]
MDDALTSSYNVPLFATVNPMVVISALLAANTVPPCIWAIALTMAKPRPWLLSLSVREESTR